MIVSQCNRLGILLASALLLLSGCGNRIDSMDSQLREDAYADSKANIENLVQQRILAGDQPKAGWISPEQQDRQVLEEIGLAAKSTTGVKLYVAEAQVSVESGVEMALLIQTRKKSTDLVEVSDPVSGKKILTYPSEPGGMKALPKDANIYLISVNKVNYEELAKIGIEYGIKETLEATLRNTTTILRWTPITQEHIAKADTNNSSRVTVKELIEYVDQDLKEEVFSQTRQYLYDELQSRYEPTAAAAMIKVLETLPVQAPPATPIIGQLINAIESALFSGGGSVYSTRPPDDDIYGGAQYDETTQTWTRADGSVWSPGYKQWFSPTPDKTVEPTNRNRIPDIRYIREIYPEVQSVSWNESEGQWGYTDGENAWHPIEKPSNGAPTKPDFTDPNTPEEDIRKILRYWNAPDFGVEYRESEGRWGYLDGENIWNALY